MNRGMGLALVISVIGFSALLGGCAKDNEPEKKPTQKSPSVVDDVADEVTGYRAVKQGQQMKEKLRGIEAERNEQISEILDENR